MDQSSFNPTNLRHSKKKIPPVQISLSKNRKLLLKLFRLPAPLDELTGRVKSAASVLSLGSRLAATLSRILPIDDNLQKI